MKSFGIVVLGFLSSNLFEGSNALTSSASCMTIRCMAGTQCVEKPTPRCVPIPTTVAPGMLCAATDCIYGYKCVEETLPCLKAPCPVKAKCVPDKTTPPPTTECPLRKCTTTYTPVCDSNGMTHSNECMFLNYQCKNPGVKLAYKGECKPASPGCKVVKCSAGYECVEETVQCLIAPCPIIAKCVPVKTTTPPTTKPCILAKCLDVYEPVCGSDGVTYNNECIALYSDCDRQQSGFTIVHKGACEKPCKLAKCTTDYKPVCGSDGVTYDNECIALYSDCERQQSGFTIVHEGACEVPCALALCLDEDKPVCGSDGVTYKNKCHALYTSCDRQESKGFKITDGPCTA